MTSWDSINDRGYLRRIRQYHMLDPSNQLVHPHLQAHKIEQCCHLHPKSNKDHDIQGRVLL